MTTKMPTAKTAASATFCALSTSSFQTSGIGSSRMTMSVEMEKPALANQNLAVSVQVPGVSLSKARMRGRHWTMVTVMEVVQYMPTTARSAQQERRNQRTTWNRRR